MRKKLWDRLKKELAWLLVVGALAALLEYLLIEFMDLHPVLSVKVQGFIGLLIFGYCVRMITRLFPQNEKKEEVTD